MPKITKRLLDAFEPDETEAFLWDSEVRGFGVRIKPSGVKSFVLKYRIGSHTKRYTIGKVGSPYTIDEARAVAADLLRGVRAGIDPMQAKVELREAKTIAELVERYLADGPVSKPTKRASSWKNDASLLRRHVNVLMGHRLARDLTRRDIERLQADILAGKSATDVRTRPRGRAIVRGGPAVAGGALRSLSAMYSWAISQGLLSENPVRSVQKIPPGRRERYLTRAEAQGVYEATYDMSAAGEILEAHGAIIRLLLLTGARKSEILQLEWQEVDLERGVILLPSHRSKTGRKAIPLNSVAVQELAGRKREGVYVFPAVRGSGPTVGLQRSWERVRAKVGLGEVRLHDLRHSFASFAAADGASLYVIGKALGHSNAATTERYAHLADDPVRKMAEAVATRFTRRDGMAIH